jgi:hypothetical protein
MNWEDKIEVIKATENNSSPKAEISNNKYMAEYNTTITNQKVRQTNKIDLMRGTSKKKMCRQIQNIKESITAQKKSSLKT